VQAWVRSVLGTGESVIMLPLPLFHVYANVGIQGLALLTGNPISLVPNPRDIPDLLATIRRVRPAFFNGVPTLYIALLNHPDVRGGKVDFRSIKICFSGAAPLLADTKQRFEALTGARIVEGYSLTEAMMAACVNPVKGVNKLGSVGIALPDVRVRVFDGDEGTRVLPPGELGEIALDGPQMMAGYWNSPDETAVALRDHVDEGGTCRCVVGVGKIGPS
jgi:long-chain acyl-CoA synthetase